MGGKTKAAAHMGGEVKAAEFLRNYDGPTVTIMEVCGTHTAALFKTGLRSLVSPRIRLISGPGCPVCVTPSGYVEKLVEWSMKPNCCVLSFGDMLRVPGPTGSLLERRGDGARFEMIYSPLQALEWMKKEPDTTFVVAAVGFETTAPAYALLLQAAEERQLHNLKVLCALKRILPAMDLLCRSEPSIDAFLCPGHVSTILGSDAYGDLARQYHKTMVVGGFDETHLLAAVYEIVQDCQAGNASARNLYTEVVSAEGNRKAQALLDRYFTPGDSVWRGIGSIADSGFFLRREYADWDAGSEGLGDAGMDAGCRCADVLCGRINPDECPLFGRVCTPMHPRGACMVSDEGACGIWHRNTGDNA